MNIISLPPDDQNVEIVREFAKEKGFFLRKVRGEFLYDLIDTSNGKKVLNREHLMIIHDYLCKYD